MSSIAFVIWCVSCTLLIRCLISAMSAISVFRRTLFSGLRTCLRRFLAHRAVDVFFRNAQDLSPALFRKFLIGVKLFQKLCVVDVDVIEQTIDAGTHLALGDLVDKIALRYGKQNRG